MTDDIEVQPLVAAEFDSLADTLEGIAEDAWNAPSLCSEWSVREVIAHVTMAARYSEEEFGAKLAEHSFDFNSLSDDVARTDGQREPVQLVADLRSDTMASWTPPGGGYHGALNHVLVHGLDATAALNIPRTGSPDALRIVLDDLTAGGVHNAFGISIDNRRLEATDLNWAYGDGEPLTGKASDLVLALTGRAVPDGRLIGTVLVRHS